MPTEPLCAKCGVRFKPKKIGVEISIGNNEMQKGELYECPICKHVIIINFGEIYQKITKR